MALNLNNRYPGRANPPSIDYPEGSIKNQTAPGAKDGTPLDADWANDKEGFFQSLLNKTGVTANGQVDKVGESQYFDALSGLIQTQESGFVVFSTPGIYQWQVPDILKSGQKKAKVIVTAAGGGAAEGSAGQRGGGSGAGSTAIVELSLQGVESVPITVAAGGLGGIGAGAWGQPGGSSSFGAWVTAFGGLGGGVTGGGFGGDLPVSSVGGVLTRGGDGSDAFVSGGSSHGGASYFGGGGRSSGGEGLPGRAIGSGGGGGVGGVSRGGNGADGVVNIEW